MQRKHRYAVFFFIFCSSFCLHAQAKKKLALTEILSQVEQQHNCSFSYNNEALLDHYATYRKNNSLEEILALLRRETLFNFTLVSSKNIAVSLKENVTSYCVEAFDNLQKNTLADIRVDTPFQQKTTNNLGQAIVFLPTKSTKVIFSGNDVAVKEIFSESLQTSQCNSISLTREVETLTPVFLTQYITQGIEKETNGTIVINTEEFVVLPGLIEKDVLFTLQALPGIQSVNENVSYLNIRGGTNDQNLMRWDGIKMYQNGHFFGLISAFNPSITGRVNFIRNGTRASLGDGVSGTIELFTDNEVSTTFSSEVGVNMISADAFLDVPLANNVSVQIAGRKSLNGIWSSPTYSAYFEKAFQNTEVSRNFSSGQTKDPDFSFYDAGMRLLWKPSEKDNLRVNVLSYQNELGFSEENTAQPQLNSRTLNSGLTQKSLVGGVHHSRQWSDTFKTTLQTYATRYTLGAQNADLANDQTLLQENTLEEASAFIEGTYLLLQNASLSFGFEFVETGITNLQQIDNPFFLREEKNVIRRNSGFTSLQFASKNKRTNLELGARATHYSKFNKTLVEPRISLSHRFLDYFSVEILGEFKSQNTSQIIDLQKDFLGVENRRWQLSNPGEIPIIESTQFSTGFSYSHRGLLINVEPYLKKVDGITAQSQGFQNQFENVRDTGSYTVKGVDLLLNKKFENATAWLSYSYASNEYLFNTIIPSEFHNNIDISQTLTAGCNYKWRQFDFSAGLNWHTGRPFTLPNSATPVVDGVINYDFPNQARIRDYVRVDTSVLYNFKISEKIKAMAGLSFWNLFDRKNHVRSFFTIDEQENITQINDRALPFTPNAAFRVFF